MMLIELLILLFLGFWPALAALCIIVSLFDGGIA